ncbi:ABC transporter ATP-binding protein [Georgenia faecalis]|uniref:ABC transporter ATP-binding protein n=1 Tax=Georgenia faecalis TaxID=2483799 RepID=A0ABV9D504_9MICO|nr:ABC transporter ATP-binding protein [Georgenia faecalis]
MTSPGDRGRVAPGSPAGGLHARGLSVRYPHFADPVLHHVDLDLAPGEQLLLMGASGSGKSTLLRVLAGIVPQTVDAEVTGELAVSGLDPRETPVPVLAGEVATLTQNPADQLCLPTVLDEVAFACENRGVDRAEIGARVTRALQTVGAAHLVDRRTSELSGGEGQRVALAAALVADPRVLLLDEPTALLDPAGVEQVGRALAAGHTRGDDGARSSVLIEHRLDELPWLPARVVVLDADGTVGARGSTEQVLLEDGARLAAQGSWLPLRAELSVALGRTIGPGGQAARTAVREVARGGASYRPVVSGGDVVLHAAGLGVRRGGHAVVTGADLAVRRGRITAVVGRNGSGKSSLLLGLAGLVPVSGRLTGGRVGMVFQEPEHQFLTRSVREEIGYGRPPTAGPALVDEALDRFELRGLAERDPFRLSGGQQRRLSLAAMAVLDDDVLLADEPTFGQDRATTRAVAQALRGLAAEGRGVVLVSHDLRLVAGIADDLLVMDGGTVAGQGPTGLVLSDPALLARAGLRLPPSLRAWQGSGLDLRAVLDALDAALPAPDPGAQVR